MILLRLERSILITGTIDFFIILSGRDPFPLFLKRNRLPRKFSITQPGENGLSEFYNDSEIEPFMTLWAYNFPFKILGCDEFTQKYYMDKHNKKFPLGGFEEPPSNDKNSNYNFNVKI